MVLDMSAVNTTHRPSSISGCVGIPEGFKAQGQ